MQNREKIRKMKDSELGKFLQDISKNYMMQYYNMRKWLLQETYDPVYIGYNGWYLKGEAESEAAKVRGEEVPDKNLVLPCRILEVKQEFGMDYQRIIVAGELMDVPARYVVSS